MRKGYVFLPAILLSCTTYGLSQQAAAPASASPTPVAPHATTARINLDLLATDAAGKTVPELEPFDFTLMDNNQPRKILSFRRVDGTAGNKIDPPVEVIIVLDAVNLPYQAVTLQRLEVDKFLRRNGGHLAQPVSIFLYTNQGLRVQPEPSRDGNALAAALDKSTGTVRARDLSGGVYSLFEQFQDSFNTINGIAENEASKPGRKIVIWIGPGWPMLTERFFIQTNESRVAYFQRIVALSKKLRDARITLYSVAPIVGVTGRDFYEKFLKPVTEPRKTEIANLALPVLSIQTGGRVLGPDNDLVGQIDACIADIGTYYTISFAPPQATGPDEYHDLKVVVNKPGVTVRTNTGYYDEPPEH